MMGHSGWFHYGIFSLYPVSVVLGLPDPRVTGEPNTGYIVYFIFHHPFFNEYTTMYIYAYDSTKLWKIEEFYVFLSVMKALVFNL